MRCAFGCLTTRRTGQTHGAGDVLLALRFLRGCVGMVLLTLLFDHRLLGLLSRFELGLLLFELEFFFSLLLLRLLSLRLYLCLCLRVQLQVGRGEGRRRLGRILLLVMDAPCPMTAVLQPTKAAGYAPLPEPPRPRNRRWMVWAAAVVVLGAAGGVAAAVGLGGGSSKPSAYTGLLSRVPSAVRGDCKDTTDELGADEQPYVITRATCTGTIDGHNLTVAYRTLRNNEKAIKKYRGDVLQLGGTYNSPGDCSTFTSKDPAGVQGTKGFAQSSNDDRVYGSIWCNNDGVLWFLQLNAATTHSPVITEVHSSLGNDEAGAPQRFKDLRVVAPTP